MIADALGAPAIRWVELGDAIPASSSTATIVLSMVGHVAPESARKRSLAELVSVVGVNGTAVVVDHNRPRRLPAAARALFAAPWVPGVGLGTRWRRLAHPTAREVQDSGLTVECLRFAAGERVQIVIATCR